MNNTKLHARFLALAAIGLFALHGVGQSWAGYVYSEGSHTAPEVIMPWSKDRAITRMSDDTMRVFYANSSDWSCRSISSGDNGRTWGSPVSEFDGPGSGRFCVTQSLVDQTGEVHAFGLVWNSSTNIGVWHNKTTGGGQTWEQPKTIFAPGYVGALQGRTQLENGRIVLPVQETIPGRPKGPPTGSHEVTALYSDNGGDTWHESTSHLTAPCYSGFNGNNFGACEPVVVQLPADLPDDDGRVWMLMRTQTGYLYESFSDDGAVWSDATPSRFYASSSPAQLLRLPDDRVVLVWNNCDQSPRVNGQGVYGGRDVIHAAISDDGGSTWNGYREVYRDPTRNDSPPASGDRSTAYPNIQYTDEGKILMITGQGEGRIALVEFDPEWLYERHQEDDFSHGLDNWSVFKGYGSASNWWRARTQGPVLVDHPDEPGAKVLHVRRPDTKDADGAVWNFPQGAKGNLQLKLMLNEGHQGASIALGDHFYNPSDDNGELDALFNMMITSDGAISEGHVLQSEVWYMLDLAWDLEESMCEVRLDGELVTVCPMLNPGEGASYLRLRSMADSVDLAGYYVESVSATAVPEPITWALLFSAIAALLIWRRH